LGQGADALHVNKGSKTVARPKRVAAFDFRRQSKFTRDHIRAYQIVQETFARQFGTILSTTLRESAQVGMASVEEVTYTEYIDQLPNPSLLVVLTLEPLPGAGIMQLPVPMAVAAVDRMLGGQGNSAVPDRPLSEIELGLVQSLVERLLRELAYSMESLTQLRPAVDRLEQNPQFAQVAAPSEQAVLTTFEITLGEQSSPATLYIPAASLADPLEAAVSRRSYADQTQADTTAVIDQLTEHLLDVPVDVSVTFNQVLATSAEIVELAVGDVLSLGHPLSEPLTVSAGGVPRYQAVAGRRGKRLAFQIVQPESPR
jgi:flagellar motor switch protein FliM